MFNWFSKKQEIPYMKIDQNGIIDIVGDFNPETLADVMYIVTQPNFLDVFQRIIDNKMPKHFHEKMMTRFKDQKRFIENDVSVHPLQSWKNANEV